MPVYGRGIPEHVLEEAKQRYSTTDIADSSHLLDVLGAIEIKAGALVLRTETPAEAYTFLYVLAEATAKTVGAAVAEVYLNFVGTKLSIEHRKVRLPGFTKKFHEQRFTHIVIV